MRAVAEEVAAGLLETGSAPHAILAEGAKEAQLWAIRDGFAALHKWLGKSARFDLSVPLGQIPRSDRQA